MIPSARFGLFAAILLAAAGIGCSRHSAPTGEPFTPVEVSAEQASITFLGIDATGVADRASSALRSTGRLAPVAAEKAPEAAWRPNLEIVFVRAVPPSSEEVLPSAEVAVRLTMVRSTTGDRLRAEGRGQVELPPGDPIGRQERFRRALDAAIAEVTARIGIQLQAGAQSDDELIASLASTDPLLRDFAMRTLAERKSRAAVPALVARLRTDERDLQLRAVGALVEIGDPEASAALVETTSQRDPAFLVQVIYALGELGGPDAQAYLFTVSTGHPDAAVRAAASEALRSLEKRSSP